MSAVSFSRFTDATYQLTGHLDEVPSLGRAAVTALARHGITSTWQLIAYFLDCGRDEAIFKQFLDSCDSPPRHTADISSAIARRVSTVGVKLAVALPANVVQSSRITDDTLTSFLSRTFTQQLEHDFQKMGMGSPGKPSTSVANLARAGITTTDMLFAAFLKKFDGPVDASSSAKAAEFYEELKDRNTYGVATGYSATIVDALKAQLDIGIDTTGRRAAPPSPLAPIREQQPPSPPGTGQSARTRPVVAAGGGVPMGIPVAAAAPRRAAPSGGSGSGSGSGLNAFGMLIVAAGIGAYYAYAYCQEPSYALVVQ